MMRRPRITASSVCCLRGIPNQMVNTPTLKNSDYKDLNLALDIVANADNASWVSVGVDPDADFFVDLPLHRQPAQRAIAPDGVSPTSSTNMADGNSSPMERRPCPTPIGHGISSLSSSTPWTS